MGDVAAGEMDGAGVGPHVAGELAHQGGLAGAVGTDQGVDFTRPNVDRDVVGGYKAAEALDQAGGGEQRLNHGGARTANRCRPWRRARLAPAWGQTRSA